jgi:hypothetical protein
MAPRYTSLGVRSGRASRHSSEYATITTGSTAPQGPDHALASRLPEGDVMDRDDGVAWHDNRGIEGRYVNYFTIGHNAFEFVLDFGQFYEGAESPLLHTRIITSPHCVKSMSDTIKRSIELYEEHFGTIEVEEE